MIGLIRTRLTDEAGQALIEYALIVSLIAVILIAALTLTGHSISGILGHIREAGQRGRRMCQGRKRRAYGGSRRTARNERGGAMVEFFHSPPRVLLLLCGMVDFGKAFDYWTDETHLAN